MNSRSDVPGYGYQLSKGATSLTESWAALKYVSNNHMMLGHLMEWFFSGIGGIRQASGSDSYRNIIISPEIVGDLKWAETKFSSVWGDIVSNWKIEGDEILINVSVPVSCKAVVYIPQADPGNIFEGGKPVGQSEHVRVLGVESGKTLCEVPSGNYSFRSKLNTPG
jgi:alpha-L-rhamnosidase